MFYIVITVHISEIIFIVSTKLVYSNVPTNFYSIQILRIFITLRSETFAFFDPFRESFFRESFFPRNIRKKKKNLIFF